MNSTNKVLIALAVIIPILLCCCCAGIFFATFGVGMQAIQEIGGEIEEQVLVDVCESGGQFTQTQYEKWFSQKYQNRKSYETAKAEVEDVFSNESECSDIIADSFGDMVARNQQFNLNSDMDGSDVDFTTNTDNGRVSIGFTNKDNGTWTIDSIN